MNCKNFKIRSKKNKRYLYCTSFKEEITHETCKDCEDKIYKTTKISVKSGKTSRIKKLERNRFSIITNNLDYCVECGSAYNIQLHEVYFGKNRQNSMKYGCVVPLCQECHTGSLGIHNNIDLDKKWKKVTQEKYEKISSRENFLATFGRNYL